MTGTFDLSFMDVVIPSIPADVSASMMTELLENNLKESGGFAVEGGGTCSGYTWDIRWTDKGGDLPLLVAEPANLNGDEPAVAVSTVIDGGTWYRPIGGEMLRLPMDEPQVTKES